VRSRQFCLEGAMMEQKRVAKLWEEWREKQEHVCSPDKTNVSYKGYKLLLINMGKK